MSELFNILNKLAPDGELGTGTGNYFYGEQKVLLWTNASPTSTFAAQTVSLDLSDYSAVEVGAYGLHGTCRVDLPNSSNDNGMLLNCLSSYTTSTTWYSLYYRRFSVKKAGIAFRNTIQCQGDTGITLVDNGYCVPYKIYGIKKIG